MKRPDDYALNESENPAVPVEPYVVHIECGNTGTRRGIEEGEDESG